MPIYDITNLGGGSFFVAKRGGGIAAFILLAALAIMPIQVFVDRRTHGKEEQLARKAAAYKKEMSSRWLPDSLAPPLNHVSQTAKDGRQVAFGDDGGGNIYVQVGPERGTYVEVPCPAQLVRADTRRVCPLPISETFSASSWNTQEQAWNEWRIEGNLDKKPNLPRAEGPGGVAPGIAVVCVDSKDWPSCNILVIVSAEARYIATVSDEDLCPTMRATEGGAISLGVISYDENEVPSTIKARPTEEVFVCSGHDRDWSVYNQKSERAVAIDFVTGETRFMTAAISEIPLVPPLVE